MALAADRRPRLALIGHGRNTAHPRTFTAETPAATMR